MLDDYHPNNVIPRLLAKYNISRYRAQEDIRLAQELFKSKHTFDWEFWQTWQIKDLVETIRTCRLAGKHKERIAAQKVLREVIGDSPDKRTLTKVDSFRPLYNNPDSEEIDIDLDIIPAAMKYTFIKVYGLTNHQFWLQIPIAGVYDELYDPDDPEFPGNSDPDTDPINIQSILKGDSSLSKDTSYTKMRLAIYSGLQEMDEKSNNTSITYPMR